MSFYKLTDALFDNFLLADERAIKSVLHKYEKAVENGEHSVGLIKKPLQTRDKQAKVYSNRQGKRLGHIQIKGALTYEESGWEALCGMSSYERIQGEAENLIKRHNVDEILFEINSGGGQAYGCFEAASYVKELSKQHNVKIISYVDGMAASGAYAWAAISDELICNPMGKVGSIGVVLPLVNTAERDKKDGVKRIYITSGKNKVPFDEDGNYTEHTLNEYRKTSNAIYDVFVSHVADMRGLTEQEVIDTEANVFIAQEAKEKGLIDSIMTKEQFYRHINESYGDNIMSLKLNVTEKEESIVQTQDNANLISDLTAEVKAAKELQEQTALEFEQYKASIQADIDAKDALIQELQAKLSDKELEAEEVKAKSRQEKVAALVAEDEVESVMSIANVLDDSQFDLYISTLSNKQSKMREEMKELGSEGVDVHKEESQQDLLAKTASRIFK